MVSKDLFFILIYFMNFYDYLIIGGGIAGTTAAETLRQKDQNSKIAILESGPHPLYSKVLIPHYLKNKISRDKIFLRKPENYAGLNIDFYLSTKANGFNFKDHKVTANSGEFGYKKLLIASGGEPKNQDQIKGLRMHTIEDADAIKEALKNSAGKGANVIGEGFIAMEFLETFVLNGFGTSLFLRGEYFSESKFGKSGSLLLEENFKKHSISIYKNTSAVPENHDLLGIGIGLERNLKIFEPLSVKTGILTDQFLRTNEPDVYAAGDIAEFHDLISDRHRIAGNWTNSFLQGKFAASNMAGENSTFKFVTSYNIVNFGFNIGFIGDIDESDEVLEKSEKNDLIRIFIKDKKIKGAVLINRFNDKNTISAMIERGNTKNEAEEYFF